MAAIDVTQLVVLVVTSREPDAAPVTPPTGGGTVGASTDPAAGVDLCGAETAVAFMDLTPPGGSRRRYSKVPINVTEADDPRTNLFGTIVRALTGRSGDLRGSSVSTTLFDTDRYLRGLEATDGLVNAVVEYYLSTEAAIKAGSTPRRVFSGLVTDAEPVSELTMRLQVSDYLQSLLELDPPPVYPQRVFNVADFPNLANDPKSLTSPGNPSLIGQPVPIHYGLLSDESAGINAVGTVPCYFVGRRLLPVYGTEWDEYVICAHAVKDIQSLFIPAGPTLSTGTSYASRVRMDATSPVVEFLMPGTATWTAVFGSSAPYREFNGRRYSVVYGFGPRSTLAQNGTVPLVANVAGIEDVGDASGDLIDEIPLQILHLLNNWIVQSYQTGSWLSYPTVNGYSRFKSSTFVAAATRNAVRVSGGYVGAFALGIDGHAVTLRDIARLAYEHGLYLGTNKDGQIIGSAISPATAAVRSLSDIVDVLAQSFSARRRRDEIRNRVLYRYARRYVPALPEPTPVAGDPLPPALTVPQVEWEHDALEDTDSASIAKYGTRTKDLSLELTRDQATAEDIVALHLEVLGPGPVVPRMADHLCGTNVELGDNIEVTHFEGVASAGWTDQPVRCEQHALNLDAMTVEVEGLDVSGL